MVRRQIPRRRDFDAIAYERVDASERVEGDGREAVVFDVVGHLPRQQADCAVRVGRTCIVEQVVAQGAAGMPALDPISLLLADWFTVSRARRFGYLVWRRGAAHCVCRTGILALAIPDRQRCTAEHRTLAANCVSSGHRRTPGRFDAGPLQARARAMDASGRLRSDAGRRARGAPGDHRCDSL
jgi:hypothetical protein